MWFLVLTALGQGVGTLSSVVTGPVSQQQCELMARQVQQWTQPVIASCAFVHGPGQVLQKDQPG